MLDKIKKTLEAYYTINHEVLSESENTDLKEQIAFIDTLKGKLDMNVSRQEFLDLYKAAMEMIAYYDGSKEKERFNHLYGYPVTVHWNGIYCDCSDGATAWNYIVSNIKNVIEEDGDDFK